MITDARAYEMGWNAGKSSAAIETPAFERMYSARYSERLAMCFWNGVRTARRDLPPEIAAQALAAVERALFG